jgi:hypothetical protein
LLDGQETLPFRLVNVASQLLTHSRVDHDHYFMTNSTTDDYGEWLRLAQEALSPTTASTDSPRIGT